jgi:hypothetical protein
VLALLLVGACSDSRDGENAAVAAVAANAAQADGGGWRAFATQANEVEGFASLAEMGQIADVVVIAQATGIDGVRRTGGEGDEGIDLAQIRFDVIRAVSDWDSESVVVEFYVGSPEAARALEERVVGFPPTLLALREKGTKEEAGLYRLVNSKSLWAEQPGGGLIAPLVEVFEPPAPVTSEAPGVGEIPRADPEDEEFSPELAETKTLNDLGDLLEAARRECDGECGLSQAAWNR